MPIEYIGADASDPGPRGLIARFLATSHAKDVEAARALLTEGSREGFDIDAAAIEDATVRIGEIVTEEGRFVVPTILEDEDGPNEMPFVVREEDGELRIDFDATLEKLMGFSPDELMDGMAESMGDAMGAVMDGVGEMLEGVGAAIAGAEAEEHGACVETEFHLPQASAADFGEKIVETAGSLGSMFLPAFMPFPDLLDTEEWAPEGSKIVTTRYGNERTGFRCVDTRVEMEEQRTRILDVTAYGMPEGQALRLVWSKTTSGEEPPMETAHVQVSAPERSHRHIGGHLKFHFGWVDPNESDDW